MSDRSCRRLEIGTLGPSWNSELPFTDEGSGFGSPVDHSRTAGSRPTWSFGSCGWRFSLTGASGTAVRFIESPLSKTLRTGPASLHTTAHEMQQPTVLY